MSHLKSIYAFPVLRIVGFAIDCHRAAQEGSNGDPYFALPFASEQSIPNYTANGEIGLDTLTLDWSGAKIPKALNEQVVAGYAASIPWVGVLGLSAAPSHIFNASTAEDSLLQVLAKQGSITGYIREQLTFCRTCFADCSAHSESGANSAGAAYAHSDAQHCAIGADLTRALLGVHCRGSISKRNWAGKPYTWWLRLGSTGQQLCSPSPAGLEFDS